MMGKKLTIRVMMHALGSGDLGAPALRGIAKDQEFRVEYALARVVGQSIALQRDHAAPGRLHHRLRGGGIPFGGGSQPWICLLYTSPSPRDATLSRMPSSA